MQILAIGAVLLVGSFLRAQNAERDKSPTTVDIWMISSAQGFDFTSYLREVTNRVQARWRSSIPESHVPGRVVISMGIARDGSVQNLRVTESSGLQYSTVVSSGWLRPPARRWLSFDQAAIAAIESSKPFPNLPADFSGDQVTIGLRFSHVLVGLDPRVLPTVPPGLK
jgi:hypothetical protein